MKKENKFLKNVLRRGEIINGKDRYSHLYLGYGKILLLLEHHHHL